MAPGEIAPADAARSFALEFAVPLRGRRQPDFKADMGVRGRRGDADDAAEGHADFGGAHRAAIGQIFGAVRSLVSAAMVLPASAAQLGGVALAGPVWLRGMAAGGKQPAARQRPRPMPSKLPHALPLMFGRTV